MDETRIELLTAKHERGTFDCGKSPLNSFIRQHASINNERGVSRVYLTWGERASEGSTPEAAGRNLLASGAQGASIDTTLAARWELARHLAAEADSAAATGDLEAFGRFYGVLKRLLGVRGTPAPSRERR